MTPAPSPTAAGTPSSGSGPTGSRAVRSGAARLVASDDRAFWDRSARTLPGATAFHDWEFLDLHDRLFGTTVERLVLEVDGEPVGIVPVARRSRRSPLAPWMQVPFLGPALPEAHVAAGLAALRRYQGRSALLIARFDVAPALVAAVDRDAAGTPLTVHHDGTVQIELEHGSEEQLDARMSKSRRRAIRRAVERGVGTRPARPGEVAAMLGPALDAAYARRGARNPYPAETGALIEGWAATRPDVLLTVADQDGEVLSIDVTLAGLPVAIGWLGARVVDRESDADAVLVRGVLARLLHEGHAALDLAGRVDDDVERYKLSFGGHAVPYLTVESVLAPRALLDAKRWVAHRRAGRSSR